MNQLKEQEIKKVNLIESLNSDLTSLLNESDVKSKFSVVAAKHPWSMDTKAIINEMNAEDQKVASTANGKGCIYTFSCIRI